MLECLNRLVLGFHTLLSLCLIAILFLLLPGQVDPCSLMFFANTLILWNLIWWSDSVLCSVSADLSSWNKCILCSCSFHCFSGLTCLSYTNFIKIKFNFVNMNVSFCIWGACGSRHSWTHIPVFIFIHMIPEDGPYGPKHVVTIIRA
jgi:hypothetical protein